MEGRGAGWSDSPVLPSCACVWGLARRGIAGTVPKAQGKQSKPDSPAVPGKRGCFPSTAMAAGILLLLLLTAPSQCSVPSLQGQPGPMAPTGVSSPLPNKKLFCVGITAHDSKAKTFCAVCSPQRPGAEPGARCPISATAASASPPISERGGIHNGGGQRGCLILW